MPMKNLGNLIIAYHYSDRVKGMMIMVSCLLLRYIDYASSQRASCSNLMLMALEALGGELNLAINVIGKRTGIIPTKLLEASDIIEKTAKHVELGDFEKAKHYIAEAISCVTTFAGAAILKLRGVGVAI